MADLTHTDSPTVQAIYRAYEEAAKKQPPRAHLGASLIGRKCSRELWYIFRWATNPQPFNGRMLRLFETGDLEEPRFVENLRAIGCEVLTEDPDTGRQFHVSTLGGHFAGSMDSAICGIPEASKTWHVGEFKTHNDKSFTYLREHGVLTAKPEHYAQMQVYMGLTGMKRALYLARNKDTDALYSERVEFMPAFFAGLVKKAHDIISAEKPPMRVSDDPEARPCSWCDAKDVCHEGEVPEVSCRTCLHAKADTEVDGKQWVCQLTGVVLDYEDQLAACDEHLFIPDLVPGRLVDAGEGWRAYWLGDEDYMVNCAASGFPAIGEKVPHHASRELVTLGRAVR